MPKYRRGEPVRGLTKDESCEKTPKTTSCCIFIGDNMGSLNTVNEQAGQRI